MTALKLSLTSTLLLVGTASGSIHIYDMPSHQLLRTVSSHKGFVITHLDTILKPPDLVGHVNLSLYSGMGRDGTLPVRPVIAFQRMREARARESHEVSLLLPTQPRVSSVTLVNNGSLTVSTRQAHTGICCQLPPRRDVARLCIFHTTFFNE